MEKILIVDDEPVYQWSLKSVLSAEGFEVSTALDGKQAMDHIRNERPDLVLLDLVLIESSGIEVLGEIKNSVPDLPVIILTGYAAYDTCVQVIKMGAEDYVMKLIDDSELIDKVRTTLMKRSPKPEGEYPPPELTTVDGIKIGAESPLMKVAIKLAKKVASTDRTVLIQGETGTGKELFARLIHQSSRRHAGPFIAINCNALPETLVESELFGFEKGAFTGAGHRKPGRIEAAEGGTLFLDEISNLSEPMQVKFLRVLQERKYSMLGSNREISFDVRIIAASNVPLEERMSSGGFRRDLYHRVCEFNLDLPPLEKRKEDIPELVKYFIDEANKEYSTSVSGAAPEVMRWMLDYDWPGNIRELKNVIGRAVLLTETGLIQTDCVKIRSTGIPTERPESGSLQDTFQDLIDAYEKDLLLEALKASGGNKSAAARRIGMERNKFLRLLRKLKIE